MVDDPTVSIVIPHYLGDILSECLAYVYGRTRGVPFEVIVADDQPYADGSLDRAREAYPQIRVVRTGAGDGAPSRGMGAGCNRGLEVARGAFAMLLNTDVEVTEGWLHPLVAAMDADPGIGACQPKVRSIRERGRFDYGGAAGGLIDVFGYPFCLGRVFDTVEVDRGQYDRPRGIFWAIGGAMFLRMSCLAQTGLMDEGFHMHMEEIDLCWRLHLAGYRVRSVPQSVVYHYGGWSLGADRLSKAYWNHRNNMVMVLKNTSALHLLWVLPARVLMELATVFLAATRGEWKHPLAAVGGLMWLAAHPVSVLERRQMAQRCRKTPDRVVLKAMYRGSVAIRYFLRGARSASTLIRNERGPSGMRPGGVAERGGNA